MTVSLVPMGGNSLAGVVAAGADEDTLFGLPVTLDTKAEANLENGFEGGAAVACNEGTGMLTGLVAAAGFEEESS